MFRNWEKSREGESNGKMRGREEKRREREERAEGRRESERVKEGGRQREGRKERKEGGGGVDGIRRKAQIQLISQGTLPHEFVHVL